MYSRSKVPPWGLSGGRDGSVNYVHVLRNDGREEKYSSCAKLPLKRGDVVRIVTANGGGYGDPRKRLRERVLADLERSEEHTSELQSRLHLVCRLLLEKKNTNNTQLHHHAGAE